jgi:hypothetical protein
MTAGRRGESVVDLTDDAWRRLKMWDEIEQSLLRASPG